MLCREEIHMLRKLASEYAEASALPVQQQKRQLWLKLNHLQMERPMLLIDQIPWNEMDVDGSLQCCVQDPYWRNIEWELRTTLYKFRHMPADMVINPYVCLPRPIHHSGWGVEIKTSRSIELELGSSAPSREFENQIRSMEDVERIQQPVLTLDRAREEVIIQQAKEVFGGIIDFRMTGLCMHLGIWDTIAMWMGVENCYFALMDEPELIHALLKKMTDGLIGMIDQMNQQELFDIHSNLCHCSHTFLNDMPKADDCALSGNAWAFGLAQLFTAVSPQITNEFEVAYMKRVFHILVRFTMDAVIGWMTGCL